MNRRVAGDPGSGDSYLCSNEIVSSNVSDKCININQATADQFLSFLSIDVKKNQKPRSGDMVVDGDSGDMLVDGGEEPRAGDMVVDGDSGDMLVDGSEVGNQRYAGRGTLVSGGGLSVEAQVGGLGGDGGDLGCGTIESTIIASDRATEPIVIERSIKGLMPSKLGDPGGVHGYGDGSPRDAVGVLEFIVVDRPVLPHRNGEEQSENQLGTAILGEINTNTMLGTLGLGFKK